MFTKTDRKRKALSRQWVINAFPLTAPVHWRETIVCNDDCVNCPLWQNGCAGNCVRWNDLVCKDCPCLSSKYADLFGDVLTVDPRTNQDADAKPGLEEARKVRRTLEDGETIDGLSS